MTDKHILIKKTVHDTVEHDVSSWKAIINESKVSYKREITEDIGMVIYTDGGCRPTPGIGGWGLHGYIYLAGEPKQGNGCKDVHTETGYVPKTELTLSHVKVTPINYIDGSGSIIPESTNNIAELEALCQALDIAIRCEPKKLFLLLDSEYVLKGATERLEGWRAANWTRGDGNRVANVPHWERIYNLLNTLKEKQIDISWKWVRGHNDDSGNTIADTNATRGIVAGFKGVRIVDLRLSDAKGYWKHAVEKHHLITEPQWYFTTNTDYNESTGWLYHQGRHGDLVTLGNRTADTCFSVVRLKKPESVLEMIRDHQKQIYPNNLNSLMLGRLDNIFNPRVYSDINIYETTYIKRGPRYSFDLFNHDDTPITCEIKPPRLAFNAIDEFGFLEQVIDSYVKKELSDTYQLTEITDIIYEEQTTKKKVERKLKLEVDAIDLTVDVNYKLKDTVQTVPVKLTLGIDIPRRNTLSSLAETDARIFVITWKESEVSFRYATLVDLNGDVGIWAGVYSNKQLVAP